MRFLGPHGNSVSQETGLPTTWSATENVVWKTALPGFGSSSPITVGDKIFLTCYSGYGLSETSRASRKTSRLNVVARGSAQRQDRLVAGRQAAAAADGVSRASSPCTATPPSTPASDGAAVYAFFGSSGVVAYSVDGKPLVAGRRRLENARLGIGRLADPLRQPRDRQRQRRERLAGGVGQGHRQGSLAGGRHRRVLEHAAWSSICPAASKSWCEHQGQDPGASTRPRGKQLWECAGIDDYICPSVDRA